MSSQSTTPEPEADDGEYSLEDLAARIDDVEAMQDTIRETAIKPRLENLRDRADEAEAERDELAARVDDLEQQLDALRSDMEAIAGVPDEAASTPDKRARDLRQTLIRHARAGDGTAKMYYKEVQDTFKTQGHGSIDRDACYKAMRDCYDEPGFEQTTKVSPVSGQTVEAVTVDVEALHPEDACRDSTTSSGGSDGSERPSKEVT